MSSPTSFPNLHATVTDGRLASPFYRRDQLRQLHEAILKRKDEILDAIRRDSGSTPAEALVEFYLTLSLLKQYYDSVVPQKELEGEYRIANGKDAADARDGTGMVYLEPAAHTFFYSVLVPLCAAVAAGNCVVVLVSEPHGRTFPIMEEGVLRRASRWNGR